jgi:DNA-binding XRE family transcriptional regulator
MSSHTKDNYGRFIGRPIKERFWEKVEKTENCWHWKGCLNNRGYGQISMNGKAVLSHRVSWEIHNGPIPEGLQALHRCDNPICVRPDHLFLGTNSDNHTDMVNKGRCRNGDRKGEMNPTSILKRYEVDEIVHLYNSENLSQQKIADKYGVSRVTINAILRGRNWQHTTGIGIMP